MKVGQEGAYGVMPFVPAEGIRALEYILTNHLNQLTVQTISDLNQMKLTCPIGGHFYDDVERMQSSSTSSVGLAEKYQALLDQISTCSTEGGRVPLVQAYLSSVLKETLNLGMDEKIDEDQNWGELGVDSLMAIEIRNRLQAQLFGDGHAQLTVMGMQANSTLKLASVHIAHLLGSDGRVEGDSGGK